MFFKNVNNNIIKGCLINYMYVLYIYIYSLLNNNTFITMGIRFLLKVIANYV